MMNALFKADPSLDAALYSYKVGNMCWCCTWLPVCCPASLLPCCFHGLHIRPDACTHAVPSGASRDSRLNSFQIQPASFTYDAAPSSCRRP